MKRIMYATALFAATLFVGLNADAEALKCSIQPQKGLTNSDLASLAKVPRPAAEATALESVKNPLAKVVTGELEAERGCLIYSFDIQVPGKKSVIEVAVDAGTGKVLETKHEGPKAQAAEAAADAAAAKPR
jgi:uncharacterized membrane protein YkoI